MNLFIRDLNNDNATMKTQQVTQYLERIGYTGSLEPTLAVLSRLQLAHLRNVPFENLSIHVGEEILLDADWLYDKLVQRQRGGFCYELNSTFARLLRALGFTVDMLAAGVARSGGAFGPIFDHLMLRVWLDDAPWLVDVGFGDSFRQPLRLELETVQAETGRDYRLMPDGDQYVLQERKRGDAWKAQYRFGLASHVLSDYAQMCVYHQTSAETTFTQKRVCTLATASGRITLTDSAFIVTLLNGARDEQPVDSEVQRAKLLKEQFGIALP